ncbi:DNA polymerase alpha catalytic subunit, partial [Desmophyllum pertusum]
GHDVYGFDLDLLLHRINACGRIPHWSRVLDALKEPSCQSCSQTGRALVKAVGLFDRSITCGRLWCVGTSRILFPRNSLDARVYDLTRFCRYGARSSSSPTHIVSCMIIIVEFNQATTETGNEHATKQKV